MSAHSYYYDTELSSLQKSTGIYYIIANQKCKKYLVLYIVWYIIKEHIGSIRESSYILPHEIIGPYVVCGFSSYLLALSFNGSNIEMWTIKPLETFNIIKHTLYLKRTHQVASLYIR